VLIKGAVLHAHIAGEGGVRNPLRGGTGRGLLHHAVDLLKRKTLGLRDEEVGVDERAGAETTPDEEDRGAEVTLGGSNHVRCDHSDDGVPEPVGGSGKSNTTRSDGEREDLADENPGTRTPGGSEEEDEDGDEGDLGVDSGEVVGADDGVARGISSNAVGLIESDSNTDDGNEELADQHAESTPEEKRTATNTLHSVERDGSRADVDESEDKRDNEGVADSAGRLEEDGGVVEDEVDTGPLLHHLERGTENGLAEVGVGLEDGSGEAVGP